MKIFAVKDMKAQTFNRPNSANSIPDMVRSFEMAINDGESIMSRFPNDFRLFHLADFNIESGEILPLHTPTDLGSAADFVKVKPAQSSLPFSSSAPSQ